MPDDARRGCPVPDQPYTTRECVQRDGTRTLVVTGDLDAARAALEASATSSAAPEGAALQAYGTRAGSLEQDTKTPPAPASDDVKARATSAVRIAWATEGGAYDSDELRIAIAVDALAAAGLLAAPSHLDRLAAWAAAEPMERSFTVDATGTGAFIATVGLWSQEGRVVEIDTDPQEAARRVLARLEATDA